MALKKCKLGELIERSTVNNKDLRYGADLIVGVNNDGVFTKPKGNTIEVDLKPYKLVNNGAFVYNPTRIDLGSLAYRTEGFCIVSHLYIIFYLNEKGKKLINPYYLYIYFHRDEFRREVSFETLEVRDQNSALLIWQIFTSLFPPLTCSANMLTYIWPCRIILPLTKVKSTG